MKNTTIKIIAFFLILVLIDYSLGTILKFLSRGKKTYYETQMQEFYEHKSNIDLVFMGSSHTYRSFNPLVFDERLNLESFNLGSSGQNPTITYPLLKELLRKNHKPRLMIMETYWRTLSGENTSFTAASYIFYGLKPSINKLEMFRYSFDFPASLKVFSMTFRNRYLIDDYFSKLINKSLRKLIRLGKLEEKERYVAKGYVESELIVSKSRLINNEFKGKKETFNLYRLKYLRKTIELALDHGIKVILISTPISPTAFSDVQGYKEIYETIKGIADEYNIEYIDYNVINEHKKLFKDENFKDDDHLNKSGVEILDRDLIQWLEDKYGSNLSHLNP